MAPAAAMPTMTLVPSDFFADSDEEEDEGGSMVTIFAAGSGSGKEACATLKFARS